MKPTVEIFGFLSAKLTARFQQNTSWGEFKSEVVTSDRPKTPLDVLPTPLNYIPTKPVVSCAHLLGKVPWENSLINYFSKDIYKSMGNCFVALDIQCSSILLLPPIKLPYRHQMKEVDKITW